MPSTRNAMRLEQRRHEVATRYLKDEFQSAIAQIWA